MSDRTVQLSTDDQLLKSASKGLIKSFGGQVAASAHTGKRQQHYSDCGLPNVDDFLSIKDVAEFERNTHGTLNHPQVTRALCQNAGGVFVQLPDVCGRTGPIAEGMAALAAEFGEAVTELGIALADREITPNEAKKCFNELQDMITEGAALQSQLRLIIDEGSNS